MKLCFIGLGKMGLGLVQRLVNAGHEIIGYDPNEHARNTANKLGATTVTSVEALANNATVYWLMVPAGDIVDHTISLLTPNLKPHDIIIDGGNSNFHDSIRRAEELKKRQVNFLDCGTSGGLKGQEIGYSLMIGGDKEAFLKVEEIFKAIAAPNGYGYMGESGAGHYVKMVHNGIEYALLQSYAEGIHLLKEGHYKNLDLANITRVWNNGSVIRSWIVELLHSIFIEDQELATISGKIDENKTGRWTLGEAKKQQVPVDLIERSLQIRSWSRETGGNFATKVVAMLRNAFGGHPITKKDEQ